LKTRPIPVGFFIDLTGFLFLFPMRSGLEGEKNARMVKYGHLKLLIGEMAGGIFSQ